MTTTVQLVRLVAVLALICAAAACATPKGRLPLALRGLVRVLRGTAPQTPPSAATEGVPLWKRLVAFACVVLAAFLAII